MENILIKLKQNLIIIVLIAIAFIFPLLVKNSPFFLDLLFRTAIYAVLAMAWNLNAGYTGLITFNHIALFGIGAYVSTLLQVLYGINVWIGMFLGGLLAAVIAVSFTYPAVRLKGLFLALATIAFSVVIQVLFINWRIIIVTDTYPRYIGGAVGVFIPLKPESLIDLQWHTTKLPYCYLALILLLLEYLFMYKLMHSRIGYYFLAIKDDEVAAEHTGINTVKYKLLSIGIAAFFSAIAGSFYAQYLLFIEPVSLMSLTFMFTISLIALVGGLGTLIGPLLGSILYVPLSTFLRISIGGTRYASLALVTLAIILIVIIIVFPEGLYGILRRLTEKKSK